MVEYFSYSAFGLEIQSEIELPELFPEEQPVQAEIDIRLGGIPDIVDRDAEFSSFDEGVFLFIPEIARFWISGGSGIRVEPEPGVPPRMVRLFLLGSAMGVLLHQRGLLPLHANGVEVGGKAFAFMGRSGAGKSTLAAIFHDRGHRVIADDVCVVRFDGHDRAFAFPGIPRFRLFEESLHATGRAPSAFEEFRFGSDELPKYEIPVAREKAAGDPIPLGGIFLLTEGDEMQLSPMEGLEAVDAVYANTYRGRYAATAGTSRDHWASCVNLIRKTPVVRFQRAWGLDDFDTQYLALRQFIEEMVSP